MSRRPGDRRGMPPRRARQPSLLCFDPNQSGVPVMGLVIRHTALLVTAIMNFIVVVLALFVLKALRSRRIRRGGAQLHAHAD